jgi:hexosaminidase
VSSSARVVASLFGLFLLACGSSASGDGSAGAPAESAGAANGGMPAVPGGGAPAQAGAGGSSAIANGGVETGGASVGGANAAGAAGAAVTCPALSGVSVTSSGMANLVPVPVSVKVGSGAFALSPASGIYVEPGSPEMLAVGRYLAEQLKAATGQAWSVASTTGAPCPGSLYLSATGDATLGAEGYQLDVSARLVQLKAAQPAGVFRGVQTLRQLLPTSFEGAGMQAGPWGIAVGTIRDFPRFSWRGTMLDVARHFFSVSDVEKLIDLAAYFKLNVFHLHLSDDQGFRIAINSWPKLTSVGGSTAVGGGAGGFYTQADYSALVAYASARYITIVPEVDVPGHTNAALASYPELNCNGMAPQLRTDTAVGYSSLCVSGDKTYQFVSDVVREIAAITPGSYIHLGGDEAKATTLPDFNTFFNKAAPAVGAAGKHLIGWDALGQLDTLPAQSIVQYWIAPDSARHAVSMGSKIVMSPAAKAYLDMKYDTSTPLGQNWAGYITEQTGYSWDPAKLVDGVAEANVAGVEAPLWTETLKTLADLEYMAFPRLAGYAEIGWSAATGRSWDEYKVRLGSFGPRFKAWNVNVYKSAAVPWK